MKWFGNKCSDSIAKFTICFQCNNKMLKRASKSMRIVGRRERNREGEGEREKSIGRTKRAPCMEHENDDISIELKACVFLLLLLLLVSCSPHVVDISNTLCIFVLYVIYHIAIYSEIHLYVDIAPVSVSLSLSASLPLCLCTMKLRRAVGWFVSFSSQLPLPQPSVRTIEIERKRTTYYVCKTEKNPTNLF